MGRVLVRTLWDTARRDLVVQLALAGCAALAVFYALPVLSAERRLAFLVSDPPDLFFFAVLLLALRWRLGDIASDEERRFWNALTVAFIFWFAGTLTSILIPSERSPLLANLAPDICYAIHYGAIFYAVQRQPHRRRKDESASLERAMRWPAVTAFVMGLVVYFVVIPSVADLQGYYASPSDVYLYVILDGYISFWLLYNSWNARSLRWRVIYGCLAVAIFSIFSNDVLEVVYATNWGIGKVSFWFLQYPILVLAIRVRHHPLLAEGRQATAAEAAPGGDVAGVRGQTLSFALLFPLIHFIFESVGLLDESGDLARQVFMIFWLFGFGTLAWIQHRALERRNRQLEESTRRFISQLETTNAEVVARNAELERFSYAVTHDLKSPLFTIQGFLGFLEKDAAAGDRERLARDVARIRGATDKMRRLVDDLLQLSRLGRTTGEPQEASLGEMAREAAEAVAGQIAERGARLEISPELPVVICDRPRIVQVLQNLIDNAVKYMGEQSAPRIEIAARQENGSDVFFVRDNGMGIEPSYHRKIFELFDQLDPQDEGTGVGLALVQRVVELHGGRVWVESEGQGRGSTFCFTLSSPASSEPA